MTWIETMIDKYGSLKAFREHQKKIGQRGGKSKGHGLHSKAPKGFAAATPEERREWGSKGGSTPRGEGKALRNYPLEYEAKEEIEALIKRKVR